jgi:hypothetical protein
MSTNINITVGDNALLDRAQQQAAANRQAQLNREAATRLEAQATAARTTALAAQGRDANGNLITGAPFTQPQIDRRPAANRLSNIFRSFYFPTQPTFDITLGFAGNIAQTPIGFMTGVGSLFKGRQQTALTHTLTAQFITHTPSVTFQASEGPFGQSCLTHFSPPAPPGVASARFSWANTSFDEVKPFTEITLEADYANGVSNGNLSHTLFWTDPATGYLWSARYFVQRVLSGVLLLLRNNQQGDIVNSFQTFPADQLMKVDLTHWHRYGFCLTQTSAFFCVDGVELARVNYVNLNTVFTASTTSMLVESITDSCRLSTAGFAPKALYSGSYSPRSILR